jgi:uncharacterized Zn finger protein
MKIPSLKDYFGKEIIEKGRAYYQEQRVKDLIGNKEVITATVIGNRNYRVTLNLKQLDFRCTCPYSGNCKHEVAVLFTLRNAKEITTTGAIQKDLKNKSKKELILLISEMMIAEPRLKNLISNKSKYIKQAIRDLDSEEDIDKLIEGIENLHATIKNQHNPLDALIALFHQAFAIHSEIGYEDSLYNSVYPILETISAEAKNLPKNKRREVIQGMVDLTKDDESFWDSIDDEGLGIIKYD